MEDVKIKKKFLLGLKNAIANSMLENNCDIDIELTDENIEKIYSILFEDEGKCKVKCLNLKIM